MLVQQNQAKTQGDIQLLNHRMLHLGMTYGDFMRTSAKPPEFKTWGEEVALQAAAYEQKAEVCWHNDQKESARHFWRLACSYYHYAQLFLLSTCSQKEEYRIKSRKAFASLAGLLTPKAEYVKVPFNNISLPGYLRVAQEGAPCVIFLNGLDSAKEVELFFMSEYFLERGLSVFLMDGPGQGELLRTYAMTKDNVSEAVYHAVNYLINHPSVQNNQIGLFGVSFGGYLATRAAASNPAIKACINLGGPYDYKLAYYPPVVLDGFMEQFNVSGAQNMDAFKNLISLDDIKSHVLTPLTIVIGEKDHLLNEYHQTMLEQLPFSNKTIIRIKDGEHVCSSRHSEILPVLGDWMKENLSNSYHS